MSSEDDIGLAGTQVPMDGPASATRPTEAPELAPGMTLNETYRLVRLLGRGGMGEVWVAEHLRLPKKVAIKVLLPSVSTSGEVVARFQREAEIGSRLAHPHIVHVNDFNSLPDGRKYIAMEYLEGSSLHDRMLQGPMPYAEVAAIMEQSARGLKVAHDAGVVHRDLKPDNIFLANDPGADPPYRVKILDFGISKIQTADRALTRDMAVMGTPGYMAPEQAMGHTKELGPEADQFALATIAYEMLTGNVAFDGETLAEIVLRVVQETPPPIESVVSGVPPHCAAAIARGMAKEPKDRFENIEAFVNALIGKGGAGARAAIPATALSAQPALPATQPAARSAAPEPAVAQPAPSASGSKLAIGLIAILLAAGAAAAAVVLMGDRGAETASADGAPEGTAEVASPAGAEAPTAAMDEVPTSIVDSDEAPSAAATPSAMTESAMTDSAMTESAMTESAMSARGTTAEDDSQAMRGMQRGGTLSPEAQQYLDEAEQALAAGNGRQALTLAQRSFRAQRSPQAREMMGRANCLMHDLGAANAMARSLPRAVYRRLARYCQQQGITLAPR